MTFRGLNFPQDGVTLGGFPMLVAFKIFSKNLFYRIKIQFVIIPHTPAYWLIYGRHLTPE